MKESKESDLNTFLKVDYNEDNTIWLTNSLTLRKIIGALGMSMPLLLYSFLYLDNGLSFPLESISHYYYTRVSSIFVVILSLLAFFMIVYKGKKPIDFYISLFAGLFALLVVLFPTNNITDICGDSTKKYAVTILPKSNFRMYFHYTAAGLFFLCLSYMSLFLFTKSNKSPSERGSKKIIRNRIYRTCGVLTVLAILILFAGSLKIIPSEYFKQYPLTFWMETIAIESFGFAWLVKGETLFKD
jgi:succinate dehydrogenase hydrophobic anchor subunit